MSPTPEELREQDRKLRLEADAFLARYRIPAVLQEYGRNHVSGSYKLCLMTWRDLDFFVEMDRLERDTFCDLGQRLARDLKARKLVFEDHLNFPTKSPITGLYACIETDLLDLGGWKIDLWGVTPHVCAERLAYCDKLQSKLTPHMRETILAIKHDLCHSPAYRVTITSEMIYNAVLRDGVTTVDDFWAHMGVPKATPALMKPVTRTRSTQKR